jgi:hypothetical protein
MRTELKYHDRRNEKLFDYYCEEKDWLTQYVFKVDGKTVYKEDKPLTEVEIQRFIKFHSQI